MYPKIKAVRGKFNSSGFTSIDVPQSWPPPHSVQTDAQNLPNPKQATAWKTVNLPGVIVYYLLLHNHRHFGQAHGTPLTQPTRASSIDWAASTAKSELILTGDFDSSKLSDLQALLFQHCRSPGLDALPLEITVAEFVSKFKSWDEGTSTSPSGLHLGHYKAMIMRNDADLQTDEGKALETKRLALLHAHVAMINYALRHLYLYNR